MEKKFSTRGTHVICDAYGIDPRLLDDYEYLHYLGLHAISLSGATYVKSISKEFKPHGVTILFLLEESHLTFHTFVEKLDDSSSTFVGLDMYTCGDADPSIAVDYIIEQLKPDPNRIYRQMIVRGVE